MPTFHGFNHASITKCWASQTILFSLLASILAIKARLFLQWSPHITIYGQWWRLITHHLAFANSSELLIGISLIYYIARPLERIWGSSKFFSFLVTTTILSSFLSTVLLAIAYKINPSLNYIPPGPFALITACLVQYYVAVPRTFTFRWGSTTKFSSKSILYLAYAQLLFSQIPSSTLACICGGIIGALWRSHLTPVDRWRAAPGLRRFAKTWILPLLQHQQSANALPQRSNYVTPQDVYAHAQTSSSSIIADWDVNVRASMTGGRATRTNDANTATRRRTGATPLSQRTAGPGETDNSQSTAVGPGEARGRTARGGSRAAVARYLESFTGAENANRLARAHETSLESLIATFPQRTREELSRALQNHNGDVERTAASLLDIQD